MRTFFAVQILRQLAPIVQCVAVAFAHVQIFQASNRDLVWWNQSLNRAIRQQDFAGLQETHDAVQRLLLNFFGYLVADFTTHGSSLLLHLFQDASLGIRQPAHLTQVVSRHL